MEAPAKRAFTADVHDAILASNAPRHDLCVPELRPVPPATHADADAIFSVYLTT